MNKNGFSPARFGKEKNIYIDHTLLAKHIALHGAV